MTKKFFFTALALIVAISINAQTFTEWHDLEVNEINRLSIYKPIFVTVFVAKIFFPPKL